MRNQRSTKSYWRLYGQQLIERDLVCMCAWCYKLLNPEHSGMVRGLHVDRRTKRVEDGLYFLDDAPCVDHLVPLSAGGPEGIENCVIACHPCNQKRRYTQSA